MEKETSTEVSVVDELPPPVTELAEDQTVVETADANDTEFSEETTDAAVTSIDVSAIDAVEDGADEASLDVASNESEDESMEAAEDESVEAAEDESVEAAENESVEAAEDESVEAAEDESVEAAEDESVEAAEDESVEAAEDEASDEEANASAETEESDTKAQEAASDEDEESDEPVYSEHELKAAIETVFFAADDPVLHKDLRKLFPGLTKAVLDRAISQIQLDYSGEYKGIHLMEIAGGYQFRTNPAYNEVLIRLFEAKPLRVSKPAMETLAIVSYRQPVAKSEVDEIRGVDCSGTLRKLLEFDLVTVVGKADDIGRPNLYGTTQRFLEFFGLGSLTELPTLEKFEIDALELVGENLKDFLPDDDAPILDDETKDPTIVASSDDETDEAPADGFVSAATGANDDGVAAQTEVVVEDDSEDPTEASVDDSEE